MLIRGIGEGEPVDVGCAHGRITDEFAYVKSAATTKRNRISILERNLLTRLDANAVDNRAVGALLVTNSYSAVGWIKNKFRVNTRYDGVLEGEKRSIFVR